MSNEPQQKKDIGALWVKTSKNGVEYMSGKIEIDGVTHELTIFANKYKDSDNKPDWKVYPSEPRAQGAAPAAKPVAPQRQVAPQQARGVNPAPTRAPIPGRNQPAPQRQTPPRREAPPAQDFGDDTDAPF